MIINKKVSYYFTFYLNKEKLIKKYIVDQNDYFLSRLEKIKDTKIKKFYLNVIFFIMEDCYDFFIEILKNTNFINRFKYINYKKGKQFYKMIALYHTIKYIFNSNNKIDINYIKKELFDIFDFTEEEIKIFNKFFYINIEDETKFEIEFAKYVLTYITEKTKNNKIKTAIVISFFYSSYEEFKKIYEKYLVKKDFLVSY